MINNIQWNTFPQYESLLSKISWKDIDSHCIKVSPARQVLEFSFNGVYYILKIFKTPSLWDRIRLFLFSRPKKEWDNLLLGKKLGLPVPEPIGYARTKTEAYIITKKIDSIGTLKEIDSTNFSYNQKVTLIKNLAHTIAQLHKNKYLHLDFHAGNILLDKDMNIYLIDLYKLKRCLFKNTNIYLKNLGMLGGSLANKWKCSSDFVRFLHYYQQEWNALSQYSFATLYNKVANAIRYNKRLFSTKFAYRCLKSKKYFKKFCIENGKGIASRAYMPFDVTKESIRAYLATSKVFKSSRSTGVYSTPFGVYKEYRKKKKRNWLFDCFRNSRAKHAWLAGYYCIARGIPTATPILFWEKRKFRILFSSYLLMEEIKNAKTLHDYLQEESLQNIQKVLYKVGKFIRWMHEQEICHRDLKSHNFMVTKDQKIILLDLDGLVVKSSISMYRRRKNLGRLLRSVDSVQHLGQKEKDIVVQGYESLFYNALI